MEKRLEEVLGRLRSHPNVVGVVEFGADHRPDGFTVGAYDCFIELEGWQPEIESLRFDVVSEPTGTHYGIIGARPKPHYLVCDRVCHYLLGLCFAATP